MKTIYYFTRKAYGRKIHYPLTPILNAVHYELTGCATYTDNHLKLYYWLGCKIQLVEEPEKWTPHLGYKGYDASIDN